jgi:hypothetical protein
MKRLIIGCFLFGMLWAGIKAQTRMVIMPMEIGISRRTKQPFTATEVTTLTQTAADGTTITRTAEDRIARDTKGRWYKEQHLPWTQNPDHPIYYVNIYDPVANRQIHIDPQKGIAMSGPLEAVYARSYDPDDNLTIRATHAGESVKTEKLGTQDIAGVSCKGRRTTHVVPAGMYGNNPAMTIVDEFWYSDKLGIDVLRRHSDPRSGEQVSELHDLNPTEPATEMFTIPQGYAVQPLPTAGAH